MGVPIRYFSWRGRLGRATWFTRLAVAAIVATAFGLLAARLGGDPLVVVVLALFVWSAASLAARRLHDIGRSAATMLVAIVPVAGPLWLLFQLTRPGVEGRNRFGRDPDARLDYLQVDISR